MRKEPKLTEVKGVAASRAKQLEAIGIGSVAALADAALETLTQVTGISPKIAENLKLAAATLLRVRELIDDDGPTVLDLSPEVLATLGAEPPPPLETSEGEAQPLVKDKKDKKNKKGKKGKKDKKGKKGKDKAEKQDKKAAKKAKKKAEGELKKDKKAKKKAKKAQEEA